VLMLGKTQINLDFLSLIRIFAAKRYFVVQPTVF